ncbi:alpha/beta hydrolase family protein [Hyphomonas oceanitis]|uniref:Peptidase S9 prolyl oligopeptidase active site domain-containing protein n=1 Tax=Hyphomonas oceanitis SCH89 TaxID=1280953 RepID=A0A059G880_9PROT|nr:prolyl oligopeptidase family serine peptidase [Hyphomonas oceanitis]KDA02899.1 peptidase S9 prolyl oligopeptidase active site domain-containing protein [Hyphomonas oceanitis SCH89]
MMKPILTSLLLACGLAAPVMGPASADPIPIDDLARLPAIENVTVTTDGKTMFALLGPSTGNDQDRAVVAAWDLEDLSKAPVIAGPDGNDSEFMYLQALKNGYVLAAVRRPFTGSLRGCSEGKSTGSTRTWVVKTLITDKTFKKFEEPFIDMGSMRGMSKNTETCLRMEARGSVVSRMAADPDTVLISRLSAKSFETELARLNLKDNKVDVVYQNSGTRAAGYADPWDGEVMSEADFDETSDTFYQDTYLKVEKGGTLEKQDALRIDLVDRRKLDVIHWDGQTGLYYILTNKMSDKAQIYTYDPKTKTLSDEPVFAHPDFDAAGMVTSTVAAEFGKVLGFTYYADIVRTTWVDPDLGGIVLGLEQAMPGENISVIYASDDRNRIIFEASSVKNAGRFYVLDDRKNLQSLGAARPWIDPADIGDTKLVYYDARDGRKTPALLTTPAGWKEGDAPGKAIVLPHGGPWARDFGGWDASGWIPFLTSRGFAVLQPQYRGSTDWGLDQWRAGDGQYGYKAQDDLEDGAAWLVSSGLAKADRMAIFGYSYGGYAAMAATTRTNSPFQCAIAGAGYAESAKINVGVDRSRFGRMAYANALSGKDVIRDADQASIPVLIFHGDRDVRVPNTFGEAFYNAVKGHTKAKYVSIADQPHSLPWTPDQQRQSLEAIEDFLYGECGLK